jgi:hypothetical protein
MPESFDGMLAELADAAASITPLPDVAAVRGRARQRTVHRRLAASALALSVLAACGGTFAAVNLRHQPAASSGTVEAPAAGTASASPGPVSSATPGQGAATPSAGVTGPFAAVAGLWQPVGTARDLLVFPDGIIGMGEAGLWPLCDGALKMDGADAGGYYVAALACGDQGIAGSKLQLVPGGMKLVLSVPASTGVRAYTVTYRRAAASAAALKAAGEVDGSGVVTPNSAAGVEELTMKELLGEWNSGDADQRRVILSNGLATFAGTDDTGAAVGFAGTVTAYYPNALRVEVPCAKAGQDAGYQYCEVFELEYAGKGLMTVVGSSGEETFALLGSKLSGLNLVTGAAGSTGSATPTPPTDSATATTSVTTGTGSTYVFGAQIPPSASAR